MNVLISGGGIAGLTLAFERPTWQADGNPEAPSGGSWRGIGPQDLHDLIPLEDVSRTREQELEKRAGLLPVPLLALNRLPVTPDPELAEQIYLDTLDHVDSFGLPPGPNSVRSKHSGFCSSTPAG